LQFIKDNRLSETDLDTIGVKKEGHRKKLLTYVRKLDNIDEFKKRGESALRERYNQIFAIHQCLTVCRSNTSASEASYGSFNFNVPSLDYLQVDRELASGEFGKVLMTMTAL
jgi:hypothetical protein